MTNFRGLTPFREDAPQGLRRHGMERTTAAYTGIVTDYFISLADTNPIGVISADFGDSGVTARRAANGAILLNIPGAGEVVPAPKQGIVKIGR